MYKNHLGKTLSKFGYYLYKKGISHGDMVRSKRISKDIITKACSTDGKKLGNISKHILVEVANELTGENKDITDFW